jgi:hypothetical protein
MTLAPEQRAAAKYLRVVSKSWEDEAFKQRLLGNPREVLQEHGLPMPAGSAIQVLEDTPQIMHLALPAKPAGQPADEQLARLALEGQGPSSNVAQLLLKVWDDPAFKQRLVADPRGILQEHGVAVPAGQSVRVVEDSAETLHVVLPSRPADGELSDEQLEQVAGGMAGLLVFGGAMLGVALLECWMDN